MNCNCGVYNEEFIENLKSQIDGKLAYVTNRDIANNKYNLGINENILDYEFLNTYSNILEKILKCTDCFADLNVEDIISQIKNKISII
jgi:hypothetical protein